MDAMTGFTFTRPRLGSVIGCSECGAEIPAYFAIIGTTRVYYTDHDATGGRVSRSRLVAAHLCERCDRMNREATND